MKEIKQLKRLHAKYCDLLMKIQKAGYHPRGHQRFHRKATKAFLSELKKIGWSQEETHGISPWSGQRYFDGYVYRHKNGMLIAHKELNEN